jgi:ubiquinone/menaquinone biosynthesis C-methylase UbiE
MEPDEYGRIAAAEDQHWWYRNTRELVATLLAPYLHPGITVLDAGCGPGGNGAWLRRYGTVVGLDRELRALNYVKDRRPDTRPVCGSVTTLPFTESSFDVVMALTILYSVVDDAQAVSELARVTKPGGVLVLFEPALQVLTREHDRTVHGVHRYRVRQLTSLAERAGLRVHRRTYAYSFLVFPAAVLALAERLRQRSKATNDSDVERQSFDPVFGALARAETRFLLRGHYVPFGLSAIVVAVRD